MSLSTTNYKISWECDCKIFTTELDFQIQLLGQGKKNFLRFFIVKKNPRQYSENGNKNSINKQMNFINYLISFSLI